MPCCDTQVTKDGVTHLAFYPSSSQLLLAAGDKQGMVSLWALAPQQGNGDGGEGLEASVLEKTDGGWGPPDGGCIALSTRCTAHVWWWGQEARACEGMVNGG